MMPVCKHRDSSDEVTMSMYKGEQVLSLWRSCVHWLCWDHIPVGKGSDHACCCSIVALEQLVDKTTGVYRWGAFTRLSYKSTRCFATFANWLLFLNQTYLHSVNIKHVFICFQHINKNHIKFTVHS